MKLAQLIQSLLTLVGTIATVEAYDDPSLAIIPRFPDTNTPLAPFGSAYYYEDHVYYDIVLPKSDFYEVCIFPFNRNKANYQTASGVYSPSDRSFEVFLNNTENPDYPVASANVLFSEEDVSANISMISLESSFNEYVAQFIISYQVLQGSSPESFNFLLTMTVTSLFPPSYSLTTSSIAASTSPTPFASAYYYEDHVYYDIVVPKSSNSQIIIETAPLEDNQTYSGVYSPSGKSFEVFLAPGSLNYPVYVANISFSEDDVSANISMVASKSSAFSEYSAWVLVYELPAAEGFEFTITVTSLRTSSSSLTTLSTITSISPTSSVATTSTSAAVPTHTFLSPYGSGHYYEDKVYFDFVFPNADYTRMRMSQNIKGPFTYVLDTVSGVYSPSNRSFDVSAVTVSWGVNMKVDAFTFSPEDISANISMVGSLTSPFVEGVFDFTVYLSDGSDAGGSVISIPVSFLDASPTSLTS